MWADLELAWTQFATAKAPVPADTGYVVAAVIGVWVAAFLADSFAFRALASIEAILPSGILFVFAAALGADQLPLAEHRPVARRGPAGLRPAPHDGPGRRRLAGRHPARHGRARSRAPPPSSALAVVVLALVVGPPCRAPARRRSSTPRRSAPAPARRSARWSTSRAASSTAATSRRSRSLADGKSYWRLTALDEFDGRLWTSERGYGDADGELDGGLPEQLTVPAQPGRSPSQALDAIWLPAAYAPERIDIADSVRYDDETASLVTRRNEVQPGTTYGVVSRVPVLEPDRPRAGHRAAPGRHRRELPRAAPTSPTPSASWPPTSPPAAPRRTRSPSCSRTGSSGTSPTTWPSPGATRPTPSPTSSRSAGATASSSPAPTRPSPARSASRRASPSGSRRASCAATGATTCSASTPTPGPRCTSPASGGCPSSRRRAAACPAPRPTPACPPPRRARRRRRRPRTVAPATTLPGSATTVPLRRHRAPAARRPRLQPACPASSTRTARTGRCASSSSSWCSRCWAACGS